MLFAFDCTIQQQQPSLFINMKDALEFILQTIIELRLSHITYKLEKIELTHKTNQMECDQKFPDK